MNQAMYSARALLGSGHAILPGRTICACFEIPHPPPWFTEFIFQFHKLRSLLPTVNPMHCELHACSEHLGRRRRAPRCGGTAHCSACVSFQCEELSEHFSSCNSVEFSVTDLCRPPRVPTHLLLWALAAQTLFITSAVDQNATCARCGVPAAAWGLAAVAWRPGRGSGRVLYTTL